MPIVKTSNLTHTLLEFEVDMANMYAVATFQQAVDGQAYGDVELRVEGEALQALLSATPVAGLSRADDITNAIYSYAVSIGAVEGNIE